MALFNVAGRSFRERKIRYVLKHYLKIVPKDIDLYYHAVVHSSYKELDTDGTIYERLEFLGDSLLGAFVSIWLFEKFPAHNEGELSRLRSKLISRKFLNKLAFQLHINHLIYFSTREDLSENSIPGNSLEALMGAIYLDKGLPELHKTLRFILDNHINLDQVEKQEVDYKSKVIQYCQKEKLKSSFKIADQGHKNGRDYFTITLEVDGFELVEAKGYSKKKAEQQACKVFYQKEIGKK